MPPDRGLVAVGWNPRNLVQHGTSKVVGIHSVLVATGEGDGPMLADDAQQSAAELEKIFNAGACQGVKASVKSEQLSPTSVPAGAGRPTFINYYIRIDDSTRTATLTLGQAGRLLREVQPDWDPDQLFDTISTWGVAVTDTN